MIEHKQLEVGTVLKNKETGLLYPIVKVNETTVVILDDNANSFTVTLEEVNKYYEINIQVVSNTKVDHPAHYNRKGAMECIDEMLLLFGKEETMIFCKLNAWKYRYRAAEKNGKEDLEKADWYIKMYKKLANPF